jgi:hypothetical protein
MIGRLASEDDVPIVAGVCLIFLLLAVLGNVAIF